MTATTKTPLAIHGTDTAPSIAAVAVPGYDLPGQIAEMPTPALAEAWHYVKDSEIRASEAEEAAEALRKAIADELDTRLEKDELVTIHRMPGAAGVNHRRRFTVSPRERRKSDQILDAILAGALSLDEDQTALLDAMIENEHNVTKYTVLGFANPLKGQK